jgi:hypothetical protein
VLSRKQLVSGVQLEPIPSTRPVPGTKAQLYLEELLNKKRAASEQAEAVKRRQAEKAAVARSEVARRNQEQIEQRKV